MSEQPGKERPEADEPEDGASLISPRPIPPMPDFPDIPENLRKAAAKPGEMKGPRLEGIGKGWATALDFVGSILGAWLIGFGVDWWCGTTPWGSLIGLGVGFVYAVYRIMRQTRREERESSRK